MVNFTKAWQIWIINVLYGIKLPQKCIHRLRWKDILICVKVKSQVNWSLGTDYSERAGIKSNLSTGCVLNPGVCMWQFQEHATTRNYFLACKQVINYCRCKECPFPKWGHSVPAPGVCGMVPLGRPMWERIFQKIFHIVLPVEPFKVCLVAQWKVPHVTKCDF